MGDKFATIRGENRPAMWNQAELSEEVDLSIDVEAEFQSAVSGYFAQKDKFATIRSQYRPAMWNQAELSEAVDLSIDVEAEFQSAVSGYFANKQCENDKFA